MTEQPKASPRAGNFILPLALFVVGMWLCHHALSGALPEGDDVPYHLARSAFGYRQIFGRGHLDGWAPLFGAGSQNFLLYGPGVSFLFTIVKLLSLNSLDDVHAFALVMCLAYASIGPAAWFMARAVGLRRRASGLVGAAAMTVSIPFSIGIAGTFDLGLVANGVAAPMFCLGVGFLMRSLFDRRRSDRVGLAVSVAGMAVTHIPTVTTFAITAVILVAFSWPRLERRLSLAGGLGATALVSLGLAAFWVLPLIVHHDPRQPLADWGTPGWGQRVEELASGRFAFTYWPAALVMAGFVGVLVQPWPGRSPSWRTRLGTGLLVAGPMLMAISFMLRAQFPDQVALNILPNRSSGYVVLLIILPAAQGWSRLWERLTAIPRRALSGIDRFELLGAVPVAAALLAIVLQPGIIGAHELATSRRAYPLGVTTLAALLRADMAPHARFAFAQDDAFRVSFGIPHPEMWIARLAGRNTVADLGGNSVSSYNNFIVDHIWDTDWDTVASVLARSGVTDLVVAPSRRTAMLAHDGYTEVAHNGFGAIYRRVRDPGHPAPDSLLTTNEAADLSLHKADPEDLRWSKQSDAAIDVTVGVGWFEKWTATFRGATVPLTPTSDGLIAAHLPRGTGTFELAYERDAADWIGPLLTLATIIGLVTVALRSAVARRRSGLFDDDRVDDEIVLGTVAAGGGDALSGVEHVEARDQLAEE